MVLCHFTGFARLVWGRSKFSPGFLIQSLNDEDDKDRQYTNVIKTDNTPSDLCIVCLVFITFVYCLSLSHLCIVGLYHICVLSVFITFVYCLSLSHLCIVCLYHLQRFVFLTLLPSGSCTHTTGWRKCIGYFKLRVNFRKRATNYRALLRKMKCRDKASYAS